MAEEAFNICIAAADTTGNAMTVAAYHVITHPEMYEKLANELEAAFPDSRKRIDFVELEKLPYLSAVIREGQR